MGCRKMGTPNDNNTNILIATLTFAALGLLLFLGMAAGLDRKYRNVSMVFSSSLTTCFWLTWLITYMHQMYPLIVPIPMENLSGRPKGKVALWMPGCHNIRCLSIRKQCFEHETRKRGNVLNAKRSLLEHLNFLSRFFAVYVVS